MRVVDQRVQVGGEEGFLQHQGLRHRAGIRHGAARSAGRGQRPDAPSASQPSRNWWS